MNSRVLMIMRHWTILYVFENLCLLGSLRLGFAVKPTFLHRFDGSYDFQMMIAGALMLRSCRSFFLNTIRITRPVHWWRPQGRKVNRLDVVHVFVTGPHKLTSKILAVIWPISDFELKLTYLTYLDLRFRAQIDISDIPGYHIFISSSPSRQLSWPL